MTYSVAKDNLELSVDGVVLQEVAERRNIDEWVIDGSDLHVWVIQRCPQDQSPNSAEAIDSDPAR